MDIHKMIAPALKRFRSKRMEWFEKSLGIRPDQRILDVGGTPFNWSHSHTNPQVTLINLDAALVGEVRGNLRLIVADGCALPFRDRSFDVAFCNSVIEHVKPGAARASFANEIRRVAHRYFVQTPDKFFPIEPHFLAPGFQFIPRPLRRRAARWLTPWGWITRPTASAARHMVDEISLLDAAELRAHFPDAEIVRERFAGLSKSLLAIKRV